jgi:hypothetical protein
LWKHRRRSQPQRLAAAEWAEWAEWISKTAGFILDVARKAPALRGLFASADLSQSVFEENCLLLLFFQRACRRFPWTAK